MDYAAIACDSAGAGTPAPLRQEPFLMFSAAKQLFGIRIACIREIIWYDKLTEVPMMPACIRGVINLRGAVVPVVDLARRLGKAATAVGPSSCIVIIEVAAQPPGEAQDMGVVVDAVKAVQEIAGTAIEPAPAFGIQVRSDFIEGMAQVNGQFVMLLNVNTLLSAAEIGSLAPAHVG
jgi:purine-binding chemotaxis protein CheW